MTLLASLRPRRCLAFPFTVLLFPLLWFVMREAEISAVGVPATDVLPRVAVLGLAAVAVSYAAATAVSALGPDRAGSVLPRPLASPSNGALGTFAAISLALGCYIVVSSMVTFPEWFDTLASGVGVVIGWPLLLTVFAIVVVGNALVALPAAAEIVLVGLGVALSAAWLFLLSGWLADRVFGRVTARTGP